MASQKILITALGTVFFFSVGIASAEVSADGCMTWNTYCEADSSITADLSWGVLNQVDIDQVHSGCILSSVNYTVEIVGLGDRDAGAQTNYSWSNLASSTSYQWKTVSNYQCIVSWESGSVSTDLYSLTTSNCNPPPDKPAPTSESWDHCVFQQVSLPTFNWTYSDPEGDLQIAYEIRIDNDSDFSIIDGDEYQCGGGVCSGGASVSYTPIPADWSDWMDWNRSYWWIVRVQDDQSIWSPWSDVDQFTTPLHPYPSPDFTHEPSIPAAEEEVLFSDFSICYDSGVNPYLCKGNPTTRYQWDFEDDSFINCDSNINSACRGNTTTSYSESGNYLVRLFVTDDLGVCDTTGDTPIVTAFPLPEYREAPPIIWMKKALASVYTFFQILFDI